MRIFVSWSGAASRQIAEALRNWIPDVVQEAQIWISSQDIEKGDRWLSSVGKNLAELSFGIIVVTPENKLAPWIMYEAGALSKSPESRSIVLLCGLQHSDLAKTPLFQFQNAIFNKDEVLKILKTINSACISPLHESRLERTFDRFWPDLIEAYSSIELRAKPPSETTDADRIMRIEAVLEELVRSVNKSQENMNILSLRSATDARIRAASDVVKSGDFVLDLLKRFNSKTIADTMKDNSTEAAWVNTAGPTGVSGPTGAAGPFNSVKSEGSTGNTGGES